MSKLHKGMRRFVSKDTAKRLLEFKKQLADNVLIQLLHKHIICFPQSLKNESTALLRVWTHQCECVIAQRVRRGQQMFSLYTRLWEEQALKNFLQNLKSQVAKRGKECCFSAIGISAYNWEKNRIPESELRSHISEIEYIKILKRKTLDCKICNSVPDKIDQSIIAFCDCGGRKDTQTFENWTLFIEQPELIVWRKPHPSGNYEYKVYGTYKDVSAEDFLSVQIDTNYRKLWDPTAVSLDVIERDLTPNSNSDLVYWEMQWPRLFANRDYVFNRRFLVDPRQKTVILLSKTTVHPSIPAKPNKYRVDDYWSSMVIKPYTAIDKPGIEFSLTYFDNPGVNIPSTVTAWVAYRALPDFLTRLRAATLKYKDYCIDHKCNSIYKYNEPPQQTSLENNDTPSPKFKEDSKENFFELIKTKINEHTSNPNFPFSKSFHGNVDDEVVSNNPTNEIQKDEKSSPDMVQIVNPSEVRNEKESVPEKLSVINPSETEDKKHTPDKLPIITPSSAPGAEVILSPTAIVQAEPSHWKYLHPTYYLS